MLDMSGDLEPGLVLSAAKSRGCVLFDALEVKMTSGI